MALLHLELFAFCSASIISEKQRYHPSVKSTVLTLKEIQSSLCFSRTMAYHIRQQRYFFDKQRTPHLAIMNEDFAHKGHIESRKPIYLDKCQRWNLSNISLNIVKDPRIHYKPKTCTSILKSHSWNQKPRDHRNQQSRDVHPGHPHPLRLRSHRANTRTLLPPVLLRTCALYGSSAIQRNGRVLRKLCPALWANQIRPSRIS